MMKKAKDFWIFLHDRCNYRLFVGVPCVGLLPLYETMSTTSIHYIPVTNENIGVGLVSGAYINDFKSAILLSSKKLKFLRVDRGYIPFLILAYIDGPIDTDLDSVLLSAGEDKVFTFINKIEKNSVPGIIFIGKGDI